MQASENNDASFDLVKGHSRPCRLGFTSKKTLRRNNMTEVTAHIFIEEPVEIVAKVMDRTRADFLDQSLPFNETSSLKDQRKNNQKRLSRKQADRDSESALLE